MEKVWFRLGKEFVRCGHEVTHISRTHPALPRRELIDGVNHLRVPGYDTPRSLIHLKALDVLYSLRVRSILPKADILVTNSFSLPILVRNSAFGKLYVHVARYPKGQMKLYSHAGRLQTVSSPIHEAIVAEAPALESITRTIPYPLPTTVPSASRDQAVRNRTILYAGRVHPEKGIALLVRAFAAMSSTLRENWRLRIVGPIETKLGGGGADYLNECLNAANGLRDSIDVVGPIFDETQLSSEYGNASIFVYPSLAERGETFGVAPLEAMANGCPPVVSNLGCFRDFISEGFNGFIFDHRDSNAVRALSQTLEQLVNAPDLRSKIGAAAFTSAARYCPVKVAGEYLDDFAELLKSP